MCVEPARRLVEQQHGRFERHAASDKHAALLAARQLEEAPRRESCDAEALQDAERALALCGGRFAARNVGAVDA